MKIEEAKLIVRLEDALEFCKKQSMLEQVVANEEWKHYSAAANALEKQIPKMVTHEATLYESSTCPNCKNVVDKFEKWGENTIRITYKYCHYCGQALDWSTHPTEKRR